LQTNTLIKKGQRGGRREGRKKIIQGHNFKGVYYFNVMNCLSKDLINDHFPGL